jgi:NitT/TauT family transport system substrate-binding protein
MRRVESAIRFASLIAACVCAVAIPAVADDALKLAVADINAFENQPAVTGRDAFKKQGVALTIMPMHGSADALQAVLSGTADAAAGVDTSSALRAFAKGAPVRVLLPSFTGASDLYWYVKADSPIAKFADATEENSIGYSTNGSLTHLAVTEFARDLKIRAKPMIAGSPAAALLDVMSGKLDIGFARAPFGLKEIAEGKIRAIGQGADIAALKSRTLRVVVVNAEAWRTKKDALTRFVRAWREMGDKLSSAEAIKAYSQTVHIDPKAIEGAAAKSFPKSALQTDVVLGLNEIADDAVKQMLIDAPLTKEQIAEFIVIPPRQ